MPEIGTSGSMSGDWKRAIGKASSTAPILYSTRSSRMLARAALAISGLTQCSEHRLLIACTSDRPASVMLDSPLQLAGRSLWAGDFEARCGRSDRDQSTKLG